MHLAVQNGPQKGKTQFFTKIAIFTGFGEGLGKVLVGTWEGLTKDLKRFGRFFRGLKIKSNTDFSLWSLRFQGQTGTGVGGWGSCTVSNREGGSRSGWRWE